jgi:hypothetical protein
MTKYTMPEHDAYTGDKNPYYVDENHAMKEIERQIDLVKKDILQRFPNCSYTVRILLWDDNTTYVECRHGDGNKLYKSSYYNNELTFTETDIAGTVMIIDKFGKEHLKYLSDEKPTR